jgi:pyridoxamine 5'-phosphate oxidase
VSLQDPITLFAELFAQAKQQIPVDPNAMVLATVDAKGRPSTRVVLLKDFGPTGFVFYTNQHSHKGQDLAQNPYASLCFYWSALKRQVRIDGKTAVVSNAEADAYFASRPRVSQIGAWASQQSEPLSSRAALEKAVQEFEQRYQGQAVPRPPHWSGYRLAPDTIEFWRAGEGRLHERQLFSRTPAGWAMTLLNP